MRHCCLGRKAFLLYAALMLVGFLYLHLYYRRGIGPVTLVHRGQLAPGNSKMLTQLSNPTSERGSSPRSRYILSLNYWEQLTMATGNLLSLVCLGNSWNASTVQPFTYNSRLYGLTNFKPDDNNDTNIPARSLDLIYDMQSLNALLQKQGLSRLEHFHTFLENARREVTVVHYISPKETHELKVMKGKVKARVERGFGVSPVIDCNDHLSNYRSMIENALNSELRNARQPLSTAATRAQFYVGKYWCVNMSQFSTPQESAQRLQIGGAEEDASIVVVNWRGMGKKQIVHNSAKGVHLNNRVAMSNTCKHRSQNVVAYSPPVLQAKREFAASLDLSPTDRYAAVHIRSEKLGLREPRMPGVTEACLEELMRRRDVLAQENPSLKFFYITDYAPYSSDTCRNCRGAHSTKKFLLQRLIQNTYFDPLDFNVTVDNGLAAAVESQFMASADFLLLCGGGGFQTQVANRFLGLKQLQAKTDSGHKDIFKVCTEDHDISRVLSLASSSDDLTPPGT